MARRGARMAHGRIAAALGALALALTVVASAQQKPPAFRSQTLTVSIFATVKDRDGRLVTNLQREDFQVLDNGKPVELTVFSNEIQPITVALLLDMSGSMMPRFLRVRESTFSFIDALLPHDRARIGTFGMEVAVSPVLTGDKAVLTRIAREELWPGGGTPMWSGIYEGLVSLEEETGRRVLLVLTDGADTGPLDGMPNRESETVRRAEREGYMVYAVGMQGTGLGGSVVRLADRTGGGHHEIASDEDLSKTFLEIADELRRQYVLGFTPAMLDGREHRLEVRMAHRQYTARARRSYVAKAGGE
jgi:Ca-activated chloride channel family protein